MNTQDKTVTTPLSPTLLTPEDSLVLLVDYQPHVIKDIYSTDHELNGRGAGASHQSL